MARVPGGHLVTGAEFVNASGGFWHANLRSSDSSCRDWARPFTCRHRHQFQHTALACAGRELDVRLRRLQVLPEDVTHELVS